MSEEEEWVSEESEHDFSASEDEWRPTKQDKVSSDSDFQIDKHSDDEVVSNTRKRKLPKGRSSSSSSSTRGRGASSSSGVQKSKKRFSQSLRNKLYNKYRPPPKTLSPVKVNSSLSNILKSTKNSRNFKAKSSEQENDDSDSSGDDNLVDPNKIDLSSSFFQKIQKECPNSDKAPEFDCNVGCLTDSASEEDSDYQKDQPQMVENFSKLHNFNNTLERAREALKKYQAVNVERASHETKADDIGALLAAGENVEAERNKVKSKLAPKRKMATVKHGSDSDWEDVNELELKQKTEPSRSDGSVQITVQLPGGHERKRNKQLELELCLKRKLNRIKKENQLDLHKTNVLCWVAHMNYVNLILNNPILLADALKMIPSKQCYPKDKTDIDYFEQLIKFYKTVIAIKNNTLYPPINKRPPLEFSLGLQIKNKSAICKRDYVFIFVILARAIGLQCRIVYNFVVASIRPALADLVPINRSTQPKKNSKYIKKEVVKDEKSSPVKPQLVPVDALKSPVPIKKESIQIDSKIKQKQSKLNQPKQEDVEPELKSKKGSTKVPRESTAPSKKNNQNMIKSKTIVKSAQPQKTSDSPNHFKRSANLSKLQLATKQNVQVISTISSPIKTRSRAGKKIVKIDQLDGADDEFAEPKRKTRAKKDKVEQTGSNNSKESIPTHTTAQEKKKRSTNSIITEVKAKAQSSTSKTVVKSISTLKKPINLGKLDLIDKKASKKRSSSAKKDNNSDEDFMPTPLKKQAVVNNKNRSSVSAMKGSANSSGNTGDRRCLSPESGEDVVKKKTDGSDYWVELYSEKSKRWYCVDLFKAKVDCAEDLYKQATHPVAYVFAWQNNNTLKDVSPRYCMHWNTTTRTLRVPQYWLDEALKSFIGKKTDRDKREDLELNKLHMDQPLPKVIGEFKNHPLYALRRHLLKFEAIYPPDALTLGFIRNEPIYARECVHTLHSREIWLKQARVVKLGETPYKIVTARPKWDRLTQKVIKGVPLEIFGIWQTQDYEPPTAENGIVPRNAYGNVELFKECMLPKKTIHLRLNGLNRVCKKLGVDCAPAMIGFDFHSGSCHPVYDGFVICEEFGDKVVEAWFDDQAEQERREQEKYEKRVYGNWKRIIRGLLIREKIKIKYNLEPLKLDD